MQPKREFYDIEVTGVALRGVVDAFSQSQTLSQHLFDKVSIGVQLTRGETQFKASEYYPVQKILDLFAEIRRLTRNVGLKVVGQSLIKNVSLMRGVVDIYQDFAMMDASFHLGHRKAGKVMWDVATGEMLEGIGHYRCTPVEGERAILCVCDVIYPCPFSEGVLLGMAKAFEQNANVSHRSKGCREKDADACEYLVTF